MSIATCPICNKRIPLATINDHLDSCSKPKKPVQTLASLMGTKRTAEVIEVDDSSEPETKRVKDETRSQRLETRPQRTDARPQRLDTRPLAERLRPSKLEEYVGQQHIRNLLHPPNIPSMILWGPPGTGKTTLARLLAVGHRMVELSATKHGASDIRKTLEEARNELKLTRRRTVLFCDEIHRLNKGQQDVFLPHVEAGDIILIGATTENPSFQLNSALLSRCKVFVLKKLSVEELRSIVVRALLELNRMRKGKDVGPLVFSKESVEYLCGIADGDARMTLNLLEIVDMHYDKQADVQLEELKALVKTTHVLYDRVGDQHYDLISAFHKSIRGSNADAAMYYLARMLKGGENPLYIARRMIRIASEDVGDDDSLRLAVAAYQAVTFVGLPEADIALAHCAVKLARAPKSVEIYRAWGALNARLNADPEFSGAAIPLHLRNAPTKLMAELGYKKGYKYNPDYKDGQVMQDYWPESLGELHFLDGKHLGDLEDPDLKHN